MLLIFSESVIFLGFGKAWMFQLTQMAGLSVHGYFLLIQGLFWIVVLRETGRASINMGNVHISPGAFLALSFLGLISIGTVLLKMPEMTHGSISWIDALFTSTSACCVTGLIVQDTAEFFTFRGQLIIMLLFQLGGLNMLTIATFIGSFYRKAGSLYASNLLRDVLDTDQTGSLSDILRKVIYYSLSFELAGAVLLYFLWGNQYVFQDAGDRLFFSVFHSVSAFNNAGFSLFTNGLFESSVRFQYGAHVVVMLLIITGGLGFIVLQDVFSNTPFKRRQKGYWRNLMVNSRVVLNITFWMLLTGALLFYVFEYNNALKDHSFAGKIVTSFFQSATTRTAGFNTVDTSSLTIPTLLVFMLFMFVGASPGSTGGGIKTTTFAVAMKAAWANIRGRQHVEVFRRNIRWASVNKTYAIIAMALTFLFIFTILLSITNPQFSLREILFEQISAIGTVGLSLGITGDISMAGKLILVVSMFVGRIGSLTMIVIFSRRMISGNYRYPNARLMIG
jgi:trk system potassium uptake protein TrkH